ncbi:MAG: endolytic transglycosylase MltG [Myxococcaceae bacterium]|nr:endolytic transglycosylase MltG [Myxococcaceae bacterium]
MKKVLIALAVLVVLGVAGAGAAYLMLEQAVAQPKGPATAPDVEFTVAKGTTARGLGPQLEKAGLIVEGNAWRFFLWKRGALNAKAGRHLVSARMTMSEIATALEGVPIPDDVPFVVIEGWRLRDIDKALAEKGLLKAGEYIKAASEPAKFKAPFPLPTTTLEGYLYPETYQVPAAGVDVHALLQRQLDTFAERFFTPHKAEIEKSGRSLHELVTMASMLEREEPVPEQRRTVAGILWKRFDKKQGLGVDATSRYELEDWNDRKAFLVKLRDPNDPYNTRLNIGLPPGPIGAPTVESLLAAARPEDNPYWYYLHDAQKKLHPSKNAAEHEALRAKFNVY